MTGEKAIRILETECCYECTWGCESPTKCTCPKCNLKSAIKVAIEALEEKRPHGEWIDEDYGIGKCWATCSECGESTNGEAQDHGFGYDYSFPNFCPNCGADMRKEGDEK